MFINFNSGFDVEEVLFEIFLGNQLIERKQVSAPEEMLKMMFLSYVQQLAQERQPMHLKMSRTTNIWNNFDNEMRSIPVSVDYWNWNYEGE